MNLTTDDLLLIIGSLYAQLVKLKDDFQALHHQGAEMAENNLKLRARIAELETELNNTKDDSRESR